MTSLQSAMVEAGLVEDQTQLPDSEPKIVVPETPASTREIVWEDPTAIFRLKVSTPRGEGPRSTGSKLFDSGSVGLYLELAKATSPNGCAMKRYVQPIGDQDGASLEALAGKRVFATMEVWQKTVDDRNFMYLNYRIAEGAEEANSRISFVDVSQVPKKVEKWDHRRIPLIGFGNDTLLISRRPDKKAA